MSARSKTVVLAPDARVDFTDILLFTLRALGDEQSVRYEALLVRAMSDLADHPEIGVRRDRLFPGCRIRPVEQHVLYYRVAGDNVEVVRILHARQDARNVMGFEHRP